MTFLIVFLCTCLLIWLTFCFLLSTPQCLPIAQIGIVANVCTVRFVSRHGWFPAWSTILVSSAATFGLISGAIVYSSKISEAEERLVQAYLNSDVLAQILATSPGYSNLPPALMDNSRCEKGAGLLVDTKALNIWLQRLLQVQTTNENLKDPSHPHAVLGKVFGVIENDKTPFFSSVPYKVGCLSTLELVLRLSEAIGSKAGALGKLEEEALIGELAAALARLPGVIFFGKSAPVAFLEMGNCPPDPETKCRQDYLQRMTTILEDQNGSVDVQEFRLDRRLASLLRARIGRGYTFFRPNEISSDVLLQALFNRTNVVKKIDEKRKELDENAEFRQQLDFYIAFVRALLSAVGQDPEVKEASYSISFWMGLEQLSVLTLIFFLAALLFGTWLGDLPQLGAKKYLLAELSSKFQARLPAAQLSDVLLFRDELKQALLTPAGPLENCSSFKKIFDEIRKSPKEAEFASFALLPFFLLEKAILELHQNSSANPFPLETWCQQAAEKIEDSRWLFGWCLSALPAIGFLSTLYGILSALGGAGAVTAAEGRLEQAIAMDSISGRLSIAFSTTIIALSGLLVLSLLDQWQAKTQRRLIEDVEKGLTEILLPNGVASENPSNPASSSNSVNPGNVAPQPPTVQEAAT